MIILIIVVVLAIIIIALYNLLIARKNNVENAFGTIDAMLKKRYDLIPNLVETVKQYMTHERETLNEITKLRSEALRDDLSDNEKVEVENKMSHLMGNLMVAVEQYPDLKASQNFDQLQRSWNEVEEQLAAARRTYNSTVTQYNNTVEMFPTNVMARMMNYERKAVLTIPEAERENVSARELFNS